MIEHQPIFFFFFVVENIPGLGASGFVEHTNDFKAVSTEKAAKGSLIGTK